MAENLDDDAIRNLNENINQLGSAVNDLVNILPAFAQHLTGATGDIKKNDDMLKKQNESMDQYRKRIEETTELEKIAAKVKKEALEREQRYTEAKKSGEAALKSFTKGMLEVDGKFGKFGGTLSNVGDAAVSLGKNFGALGTAAGYAIKGLTAVGSAMLNQTDAALKAVDDLSAFGSAGQLTTKEVIEMGHAAGLSSDRLEKLTKPIASMSTGIISLGATAGEGAKEFAKLTAVSSDQREAFQRLGISQEQLIQNQADYVNLQARSGIIITDQMKSSGALRKASLEYQERLLELSALTGQSTEEIKKQQEQARAEYNFKIKQTQLSMEAAELEKQGRAEEAAQVRQRIEANNKLLDSAIKTGDKQQIAAIQSLVATEAVTKESAVLVRTGQDVGGLLEGLRQGRDVSQKYEDQLVKGTLENVKSLGNALVFSKELAGDFGATSEALTFATQRTGKDLAAAGEEVKKAIGKPSEGKTGEKVAEDPAQKARNALTTAQIELTTGLDGLLKAVNPLITGFGIGTAAVAAFTVAVGIASAKLGLMAGKNVLGGVIEALGKQGGSAAKAADALTKTGNVLGKLAGPIGTVTSTLGKAAGPLAAVAAVGTAVVGTVDKFDEVNKQLEEKKITKEEATVKKSEAVGEGAGGAVGGVAGALKGAALGAALGSAVPLLGTAVGGIIGAALGGFAGTKIGEAIGGFAGEKIGKVAASTAKTETDKKEKEEKLPAAKPKNEYYEINGQPVTKEEYEQHRKKHFSKPLELPKMAKGGIVDGPKEGFGAVLHGAEAVVPLPDNKSIPVEIKGMPDEKLLEQLGGILSKANLLYRETTQTNNFDVAKNVSESFTKALMEMYQKAASLAVEANTRGLDYIKELAINQKSSKEQLALEHLAKGGITKGPSIAGEAGPEAVVPLPDGKAIPVDFKLDTGLLGKTADEDIEESLQRKEDRIKLMDQFDVDLKNANIALTKLTGNFGKLNEEMSESLEDQDPAEEFAKKAKETLSNAFKGAFVDINKLKGSIKDIEVKTDGSTSSAPASFPSTPKPSVSGSGIKVPESKTAKSPAMEGALGTGLKPATPAIKSPAMSGALGTGLVVPKAEQQKKVLDELSSLGITDKSAQANILAQVQAESGFKSRSEELEKYSAKNLFNLYGAGNRGGNKVRFNTIEEAQAIVDQGPEAVGNIIYGGRMGNAPDEGYKYRGRGLIQLTGKSNYAKFSKLIGVDLVENPDLANDPDIAAKIAAAYFAQKQQRGVDLSDIQAVGKAVGYAGGEAETRKRTELAQAFQKQLSQAREGGIFSGPETGYPVELHGKEIVAPIDPTSMLAKLVEPQNTTTTTPAVTEMASDGMREMLSMNSDMMNVLVTKLDDMINLLGSSNSTQEQLLKYSRT